MILRRWTSQVLQFYQAVSDIKSRMKGFLADIEVDKEKIMTIVNAARTLGVDRGEDEQGEMHHLASDIYELYEEEVDALDEMEEEYRKDRHFLW